MKVTSRVASLFVSALSQSMDVRLMQKVVRTVIPGYDIYARSGFPAAIPMPRADAARYILKEITREGYFIRFVESLIEVTTKGYMSRDVRIPLLPRIIAELEEQGYRYSAAKGMFVEAGDTERTMGWGTLREGQTYEFALLSFDIVGNSEMVRRLPRAEVTNAFAAVRDLITRLVEKRDGRIWSWEGDGGIAAFYFLEKTIQATLCGMEVVNELFLFNLLGHALPEPVRARLAVHAGPCRFLMSVKEAAGDTIRRAELLESRYTPPGCLTVSPGVFTDLGSKLAPLFMAAPGPDNSSVYRYALEWDRK